jgi:hypothetical protein
MQEIKRQDAPTTNYIVLVNGVQVTGNYPERYRALNLALQLKEKYDSQGKVGDVTVVQITRTKIWP